MTDLNTVCLVGRLTKDAELVQKGMSGMKVLTFTIAVNRDSKKKDSEEWEEKTSFFDCALFGDRAERMQRHLLKGKVVSVQGHLEQDVWEKDGERRSRIKVVPERINPFVERTPKAQGTEAPASPEEDVAAKETEEIAGDEFDQFSASDDIF